MADSDCERPLRVAALGLGSSSSSSAAFLAAAPPSPTAASAPPSLLDPDDVRRSGAGGALDCRFGLLTGSSSDDAASSSLADSSDELAAAFGLRLLPLEGRGELGWAETTRRELGAADLPPKSSSLALTLRDGQPGDSAAWTDLGESETDDAEVSSRIELLEDELLLRMDGKLGTLSCRRQCELASVDGAPGCPWWARRTPNVDDGARFEQGRRAVASLRAAA